MKTFLLSVLLLAITATAQAQTLVDYNLGGLEWVWSQGTGGPATEFRTKCGPTPGSRSTVTVLPLSGFPAGPNYRVAYPKVLPTTGIWYCTVTAASVTASGSLESGEAPEGSGNVQKGPLPGSSVSFR